MRRVLYHGAWGMVALALMGVGGLSAVSAQTQPKPELAALSSVAKPPVATDGDIAVEAGGTRVSLILSAALPFSVDLMTRPDRVVVDLPEVNFQLAPDFGRKAIGLVRSARAGLFAHSKSRIVIELASPALAEPRLEEVLGGAAQRLTISLRPVSAEDFARAAQSSRVAVAPARPNLPPLASDAGDRRPLIVLDPGHGGIDVGAVGVGQAQEKDVVLAFAQEMKAKLEATGQYRVALTRDGDVFVSLGERVRTAQRLGAALFISIHADTLAAAPDVRGFTVYTGSEKASDAEAARLAEAENLSDQLAGADADDDPDEIAGILGDLTLRETRSYSHLFARTLVGQMSEAGTKANKNPHRAARFRVLRAPDVPSVLLELGYLSSKTDAAMLKNPAWRAEIATTLVTAVNQFMAPRLAGTEKPPAR